MKNIYKIISLSANFKKYVSLNIIYNVLGMFFSLFSFAMIIPILRILFTSDNLYFAKLVNDYKGLEYSSSGIQSFINYQVASGVIEHGKFAVTLWICLCLVSAIIVKNLFAYLAMLNMSKTLHSISMEIRKKFYEKMLALNLSFFSDERKGDLLSRITSDVREVELAFMSSLDAAFKEPFYIIGYITVLFLINFKLSIFIIVFLPVAGIIISQIGKSLRKTTKEGQIKTGELLSQIEESIGGLRIIKAFNAEQKMIAKFEIKNKGVYKLLVRIFKRVDMASPVSEVLGIIATCCVLLYGGDLVLSGSLDPDYFIGYIILFSQLIPAFKTISKATYESNKGVSALERIEEITKAEVDIKDKVNAHSLATFSDKIEYKNITFKYENEYVLRNVTFTINKGKTIALVGQSGSGKSTLADLLPRFYEVKDGEILIDGYNIKDITMHSLRDQLGIVTQQSILFNDTVFNNIALGVENATIEDIVSAAKIANAHEFILQLENGYHTNIGDSGDKLSGGQKQRLNIARAILKNPPILILDEATSALDTESERLVQDALNKLMKNRTSIIIAHRLSTIQHADEIIVLQKGEIIERGTHSELLSQNGTYRKLSDLQIFS